MAVKIQFRRDTDSNWAAANPVLALGEVGFSTDSLRFKLGDGTSTWSSLGYSSLSNVVVNSDSTAALRYLTFSDATSGILTKANVNTSLIYNPSTSNVMIGRTADSTIGYGVKLDVAGAINAYGIMTTSTGNVMINKTTDSTTGHGVKLDIIGGINAYGLLTTSAANVYINRPTGSSTIGLGVKLDVAGGINAATIISTGGNVFVTSGNVLVNRGTTDSTVGLGVKLDVAGGINAAGLLATTSGVGIFQGTPTANLHIGAGVADQPPLKLTSGTLTTNDEAGAIEYDGTTMTITPSTNYGRATIPLTLYNSGVGTSSAAGTTAIALFPAASDTITLPIGTYLASFGLNVHVAGSVTSGGCGIDLRGNGNAVGTYSWRGTSTILNGGSGTVVAANFANAATALGTAIFVTAASAINPRSYIIIGQGILKVTTAGTIIPSYQFTAALASGVTTLVADNHMILQQLDTQSAAAFGPSGAGWG